MRKRRSEEFDEEIDETKAEETDSAENWLEDDEISAEEEGFLRGCEQADETDEVALEESEE